jgi:hypothetical protein
MLRSKVKSLELETLERVERMVESIAYTAPELADQRRAEIIASVRREIREWRKA